MRDSSNDFPVEFATVDRSLAPSDLIRRRGSAAVALGRRVAVMRAVIPGVGGTSGKSQANFTVANVVGGAAWATSIASAGYVVGASYQSFAKNLGYAGDVIVVAAVAGCLLWWIRHHRRGHEEPAGQDTAP